MLTEINIDALVGPTHHYGGLGIGNLASHEHSRQTGHPKRAAEECLAKAALVARMGIPQFIWLPPERPRLDLLSAVGFSGSLDEQLAAAYSIAPHILSAVFSSSFMWAANSATVSPAVDAADGHYHFTPANLLSSWHRGVEALEREVDLKATFQSLPQCRVHAPLPCIMPLRDEGAANHMRLCDPSGQLGFNVFVFGEDERDDAQRQDSLPLDFRARQTRAACEAISRRHRLSTDTTFYLQQHPQAISAGVFHNDVIATSHQGLLIHHQLAFVDADGELDRLERVFRARTGQHLQRVEVSEKQLPLGDAVRSYFFNSQLLTMSAEVHSSARSVLIAPAQCQSIPSARQLIETLVTDPLIPIDEVHFVDLEESMAGGGGPACLRLRVPMDQAALRLINPRFRLDNALQDRLAAAIDRWYPEKLDFDDLRNTDVIEHATRANQELARAVEPK